jgi:multidrug resistance efflux pump
MMPIRHPAIKENKMEAQLKEWDAQINLLEAKVESAGADIKVMRARQLHDLRAKQRAASEKMKELGESSGAAWEQVKITSDKIWDDLKAGVETARSSFK